ncbi:hypothetical protein PR003_g11618 [Phytophthora rubi]|uniref:Uncharacterized protein n=1 Tax=Phytophthora rubi TaxID=129364 RepID=A0A6A4FMT0_9STRA|nr:hypothetical protein PR003_g11618 [Phytophthora rubi]
MLTFLPKMHETAVTGTVCLVPQATNTAADLAWRTSRAAIGTTGGDDELDEMRVNPGTEWHEDRTLAILGASGRSERNERPPAARRRVART